MPWVNSLKHLLPVASSNHNELSYRTARNVKHHTSALEKAKNTSAGNKIRELKAELAILMAEAKVSSFFHVLN
jgi:hypothetical protein